MCRWCSIHPTWRWRSASPFSPSNLRRTHFPWLRGTVYHIANTAFIIGTPEKIAHICSLLWHPVVLCVDTKISEEHTACIFRDTLNRCYIILEIGSVFKSRTYTLKMEVAYTSKSLLYAYQTTWCHNATDDCLIGVTPSNLGTIPTGN